jgi:hypothetical protein
MRGILLTGADRLGADGEVFLLGGAGVTVPDAIAMASDLWNPQVIPNIERLRSLRGAHVGTQDGVGWLFKGTLVPGSGGGRAKNMRLPVIAARRDGRTVLLAGVAFFDKEDARNHNGVASVGMDYLLTEFRWPGGQ